LPRRSVLPERLVPVLPGLFGKDVVEAEVKRLLNEGQPLRQLPAGVNHSANMADPENWVNPLRGYAYDSFNPDVLSTATVKKGSVVFESGASYRLLVIPGKLALNPNSQWMSLEVAKKLLDLAKSGATILLMEKPDKQPGLQQGDDAEFNKIVAELWDGNFSGKVLKGAYQDETLAKLGVERDLIVKDESGNYARKVAYTHRTGASAGNDIYFISNQEDKERVLELSLRTKSSQIELYDAVTNRKWEAEDYRFKNNRTIVPVKLAPNASLFVICKPATAASSAKKGQNWKVLKPIQTLSGSWKVQFDPKFGGPVQPVTFSSLTDWTASADTLIKYYSGTAIYSKEFKTNVKPGEPVWLDLGKVANIAEVKVNGVSCGVAWTAPYRVDINKALKKGNNSVSIEVTNTWANRLMGDQRVPVEKRITNTVAPYRLEGKPLQEAGLFGPVELLDEVNVDVSKDMKAKR